MSPSQVRGRGSMVTTNGASEALSCVFLLLLLYSLSCKRQTWVPPLLLSILVVAAQVKSEPSSQMLYQRIVACRLAKKSRERGTRASGGRQRSGERRCALCRI
ncbi:hypothetical protein BCV70DRAFT_4366 [Testicularia cyperi]|uniref:Uncharacterized protein n=1 Tax=Testicularia cyperi TaxID=1882483 RepID=A0A317XZA3_9BASI|nr:hypothetical protein BCV70DRAFT_4366 [Testicularia cyperi]